jgi:hypothetical protein
LSARGVEFPQAPVQQPFGWWSMFNDTEGNRFALEQTEPYVDVKRRGGLPLRPVCR